ncbi:MAG: translation elongation factor-like protein [Candidatus Altiarchaeales archaeon]|nr:translation elongation factor-like protein [Candidatus Altiarchaeales archaeon]
MTEKTRVGEVFTYFQKVGVAGIKLSESLKVGDKISIEGTTTNIQQTVDSIQIDRNPLQEAVSGQEVGIKVADKVRTHDIVYKIAE